MAREILYGRRPVYEALRAGRRDLRRVILAEQAKGIEDVVRAAQAAGVRIEGAKRSWLEGQVSGANHQGVILETSAYRYIDLPDIIGAARERGEPPLILLLDLIQDVQNVGTLLRTAEAVGVHGVILQERRAAGITPAVVSASSGAVEHLNVAQVTNLVNTMKLLKEEDVWLAGLDAGDDAQRIDQANLKGSLGLVVGSEGKGLRRLVRETCDFLIRLPMRGQVESLNASVAGSIALYAAWGARDYT